MLAVDTNILVRYLTADEPKQAARVRRLVDGQQIFVATTVLLEAEWVLRSLYRFEPARLADALAAFCGLPTVRLEDPERITVALQWMRAGMDFADALHLAAAGECEAFVSLDPRFVRKAKALGLPVRLT